MTNGPETYWVVGPDTGIGKTTLACALIKVLNQGGVRAAGFKPRGGIELRENIDFILSNYPDSPCTLFGGDALKLSLASPLTNEGMMEVLAPVMFLTYPVYSRALMLRTGASMLNNIDIYRSPQMEKLRNRDDIARIIGSASLPVARSTLVDRGLGSIAADADSHAKCSASFSFVADLGCDAVVMEGASQLLPVWKGAPDTNHLFVSANGFVSFFPNINLSRKNFDGDSAAPMKDCRDLIRHLRKSPRTRYVEPFHVAESESRAKVAERIMATLLAKL